jgi:periplasmic protein TonB
MSVLLEGAEHLEEQLTPEPVMAPAAGSLVLHLAIIASVILYGIIGGFFHRNFWGGPGQGGAIQVNIVSNALPLPTNQPINQNVLSTETPSEAPAPPAPKEIKTEDLTTIPIQGKPIKPKHETVQRTPPQKQQPVEQNRAQYGEQAGSNIPRTSQQAFTAGHTSINDASFGSMFAWYVTQIDRTMDANSSRSMADPRTPRGAKATIQFNISRDGTHDMPRLFQSSGSPSWDAACVYAARRVDRFGPLPDGYRGSYLQVLYDCTY